VILEIAPNVFAWYAHLRRGSLTVKVGDAVKAGAPIAKLGNTGPSEGPHLHLGLVDKPDAIAGRSLPFVFDSFTLVGAIDFDASRGIDWYSAGFAAGSVRVSALRRHPKLPVAPPSIFFGPTAPKMECQGE